MIKYYNKPRIYSPAAALQFLADAIYLEHKFSNTPDKNVTDGLDILCKWLNNVYHVELL